jgi:hypothetical protein
MSDHPSPRHPPNLATPLYSIRDGGRRNRQLIPRWLPCWVDAGDGNLSARRRSASAMGQNSPREMAGRPESRPRASRSLFFVVFVAELTSVGVVLYVENALAKFVVLGEQCLKGRLWVDALSRYFGIIGHFRLGIPLFS